MEGFDNIKLSPNLKCLNKHLLQTKDRLTLEVTGNSTHRFGFKSNSINPNTTKQFETVSPFTMTNKSSNEKIMMMTNRDNNITT